MIKRALISVSDKNGLVPFAKNLATKGVEILSTGGTAKLLRDNDIEVIDVSTFTGSPEMMDGRVKTLHPKVHAGLLAVRDSKEHMAQALEYGIGLIDLVVVNLYPFAQTIAKPNVTFEEAIENIDIGGPSMLRSASKNFKSVTVITDPKDYEKVWKEISETGDTTLETRRRLAEKVFELTSAYDGMIASYLNGGRTESILVEKIQDLRYGENPHQKAAFYSDHTPVAGATLTRATFLQGKELSYNNIMDADAELSIVREFKKPAVTFIKHANPCGTAIGESVGEAFVNAYQGDPKSAFGGIIAMNQLCTADLAEAIVKQFYEVIIAPDYEPAALEKFKEKPNMRVLKVGPIAPEEPAKMYRRVYGGLLIQDTDNHTITEADLKVVTQKQPTKIELRDMLFAWKVVKHVKSNAIVLAKNGMTVGVGAGQMSRVDSVEVALHKAGGREKGCILASDAFFPFADSIEAAAAAGITAIIQPGGSVRDAEVIAAADKLGIAMVFTGKRCFLH
jgi:phosphoribosylaminoimidazolecarboxamide formyltransferase/IMP cyclohydrolase